MQKITPFLWFDTQAEAATGFYTSVFNGSRVVSISRYGEAGPRPAGTVMTATFQLEGQEFMALNGGPEYKFTPALSFFVNCVSREELDGLWQKLSEGGTILMELGTYPFSDRFGWLQDKFGLSWQLSLGDSLQKIVPFLMFVGEQHGRAEAAVNLYTSLFGNSEILHVERYGKDQGELEGTVKHAKFTLDGQEFLAIDGGQEHSFSFTEAISLFVTCQTQGEVDYFWEKLTEGGEEGPCGWLKDKFGVSWQIVPAALGRLLGDPDPMKAQRVMQAMLQMTKIDIEALHQAYEQG